MWINLIAEFFNTTVAHFMAVFSSAGYSAQIFTSWPAIRPIRQPLPAQTMRQTSQ